MTKPAAHLDRKQANFVREAEKAMAEALSLFEAGQVQEARKAAGDVAFHIRSLWGLHAIRRGGSRKKLAGVINELASRQREVALRVARA